MHIPQGARGRPAEVSAYLRLLPLVPVSLFHHPISHLCSILRTSPAKHRKAQTMSSVAVAAVQSIPTVAPQNILYRWFIMASDVIDFSHLTNSLVSQRKADLLITSQHLAAVMKNTTNTLRVLVMILKLEDITLCHQVCVSLSLMAGECGFWLTFLVTS